VLLLVDDDEPQVGEPYVLRGKRLRADHDLQFPAAERFLRLLCFRS
jgi:hypothetical protein